jgi:hypothetical protein
MKLIMVLGGAMGFGIGAAFSLAQGSSWSELVWRSSFAALLGGILLRWWGRLWLTCLRDSLEERQAALNALKKQAPSNPSNPSHK